MINLNITEMNKMSEGLGTYTFDENYSSIKCITKEEKDKYIQEIDVITREEKICLLKRIFDDLIVGDVQGKNELFDAYWKNVDKRMILFNLFFEKNPHVEPITHVDFELMYPGLGAKKKEQVTAIKALNLILGIENSCQGATISEEKLEQLMQITPYYKELFDILNDSDDE